MGKQPDKELYAMTLDEVVEKNRFVVANSDSHVEYRCSIPHMTEGIDKARKELGNNCKTGRMTRFITLHAWALGKADPKVKRVERLRDLVGADSLRTGDNVKAAALLSLEPYSPQVLPGRGKLSAWTPSVHGDITTMAENCGVTDIQFAQIYAVESLLKSSVDLGASAAGMREAVAEWERWLDHRAWRIYTIIVNPELREKMVGDFLAANPIKPASLKSVVKRIKKCPNEDSEWRIGSAGTGS